MARRKKTKAAKRRGYGASGGRRIRAEDARVVEAEPAAIPRRENPEANLLRSVVRDAHRHIKAGRCSNAADLVVMSHGLVALAKCAWNERRTPEEIADRRSQETSVGDLTAAFFGACLRDDKE